MDPLKIYFLLKIGIFQPAMLVYQRVTAKNPENRPQNFPQQEMDHLPSIEIFGGELAVSFRHTVIWDTFYTVPTLVFRFGFQSDTDPHKVDD